MNPKLIIKLLSLIFVIFLFSSCGSDPTENKNSKKCESDLNCLNGQHCSEAKECIKNCTDESCDEGQECNSETKKCESLSCNKNSECNAGYFCENKTCKTKEYPCSNNSDCFQAYECIDEQCSLVNNNECNEDLDCPELPLPINCIGHWACESNKCIAVCDTNECGNNICEETLGENFRNCPRDCRDDHCDNDIEPLCDMIPPQCNDGEILAYQNSCYQCVNPETCEANKYQCDKSIDCINEEWNIRCLGHWACESKECVAICDNDLCGDGFCDNEQGESRTSCSLDCGDRPECQRNQDCETGKYCSENQKCRPVSEACGDQFCDDSIGENEDNCRIDCNDFNFCFPDILECQEGFVCIETRCVEQ